MPQDIGKLMPADDAEMRASLSELPLLEPPARSWQRLCSELETAADAPVVQSARKAWPHAASLAGLALVTALLATVMQRYGGEPTSPGRTESAESPAVAAVPAETSDYESLAAESAWLDNVLKQLPAEAGLMPAGTVGTIVELEDQIAMIDAHLSLGAATGIDVTYRDALWSERVDLMNALLQVRMAHAQRHEF